MVIDVLLLRRIPHQHLTGAPERCPQAELKGGAREYVQAEGRRRLVNERLWDRLVRITEEGVGLMPGLAE